ncbi:cation diffusion facilitator family transporter [Siminovitchia sp. FSL H7-0308]|uniref:Cation diffusion facilitator family transporter n=1 Tax=Siminovitchia thermophila TaxID=1245522 RepID=A0ABS2R6K2_9BACI|nr:cation diffusion facilitator family transporter [Siminovitchia thermophila]MBM7715262.1 cation diffusion facilitator family transporter [Siminovitchia thermophila]
MSQQSYENLKMGERGAILSIGAYIFLSILKLYFGYTAGSEALKADGLNNTTDIAASIAVLIGLKLSQKPPDKDHRYGHWKSETIASMTASFIMLGVGIQVLNSAFKTIIHGQNEPPDTIAAYVALFSAAVMYFVYVYNKRLAKKIRSTAVMAAAKDNLSDAWVSIGTVVAIIGSQFRMPLLDSITAFIVGLLICKTAWDIFKQASHELSDGFDENKISLYKKEMRKVDGVKGIKEVKGRNYGSNEVIDVVILVDQTLDIQEAHNIATLVEEKMKNEHGVYDVHVHVEPEPNE